MAITGLNRSTVGALVSELTNAGLVSERAGSAGAVGRPSLIVVPEPGAAIVLAFDIRVDRIVGAVAGLGGEQLARVEQRHGRSGYGPDAAVGQMAVMAHELLAAVPVGATWVGVGVGVPGIVDTRTGEVKLAPNLDWVDVPIGPMVHRALASELGDVPHVVVGNDADLGAIAEHSRGAAAGAQNVIYLSGEVGIGGGIVLNGQLMSGAGGFGGEVGHMTLDPRGEPCHCGSRGCWETLVGRDAVILKAGRSLDEADVRDVVAAAIADDAAAKASLHEFANWLGIGLRNLVNVFNPEVIVLGGHLGAVLPELAPQVDEQVNQSVRASLEQVRIVLPALGPDSTLAGAAEIGFSALLGSPLAALEESSTLVAS